MPQKRRLVVPTLRGSEAAGNTLDVDVDVDVDVDQQLLIQSAGGNHLPNIPLPDIPLSDVPLPNVPHPNIPLYRARPDVSVGEK